MSQLQYKEKKYKPVAPSNSYTTILLTSAVQYNICRKNQNDTAFNHYVEQLQIK